MQYYSTRGEGPTSFRDTLLQGLAGDGGLFVPEQYPALDLDTLRGKDFTPVAAHVLARFAGHSVPSLIVERIVRDTYTPQHFGGKRVARVDWLDKGMQLGLLRLSEGPTHSFKDMALQVVGRLMEHELSARGDTLTVLAATSGDTGSAAAHALRGRTGMSLTILIPHGRMSDFQRRQMTTIRDKNISVLAVRGTFDDCQRLVKETNADRAFKARHRIGAMNSINWARIAAQTAYWVYASLEASAAGHERIVVAVPSGNFGNALSAYIARRMGCPIDILVCTNENDILDVFCKTGRYEPRESAAVAKTTSPSMDIAEASNLERLIYDMISRNPAEMRLIANRLKEPGGYWASDLVLPFLAEHGISSGVATEAQVRTAMNKMIERHGAFIDPHTAVAVAVALRAKPELPVVVAETALPVKFAETMHRYCGVQPVLSDRQREMMVADERYTVIEPNVDIVKAHIAAHSAAIAA